MVVYIALFLISLLILNSFCPSCSCCSYCYMYCHWSLSVIAGRAILAIVLLCFEVIIFVGYPSDSGVVDVVGAIAAAAATTATVVVTVLVPLLFLLLLL